MDSFSQIWTRIEMFAGETFYQKRGKPFTYEVLQGHIKPSNTNRQLPRSHFARAYERTPLTGPGQLQDLQGPSYLYAILSDPRIRTPEKHSRTKPPSALHGPAQERE